MGWKKEFTEADKAAYAVKAKEKTDAAVELLKKGVTDMFTSENYARYLKFYAGFHQYSFGNMVLILTQLPEATICANYKAWEKKGRHVKKGAKGILVRVPTPKKWTIVNDDGEEEEHATMHFKVGSVFDISQTEGEAIPEICHKLTGDVAQYEHIVGSLKSAAPVVVEFRDIDGEAHGFYSQTENKIVIRDGMSQEQTIKTMAHEIAHSLIHCEGGAAEKADRQEKELQAESVAYVVCNYLGIDSGDYSFGYVTSWAKGKAFKQLEANVNLIGKTAMTIISKFEKGE